MKVFCVIILIGVFFFIGRMWVGWWEQTEVGLWEGLLSALQRKEKN